MQMAKQNDIQTSYGGLKVSEFDQEFTSDV